MKFDHLAVPSSDFAQSILWYEVHFGATVIERDAHSVVLMLGGIRIALINPHEHPPHVALTVSEGKLIETSRRAGLKIEERSDGSRGLYIHDPFGNAVELICPPVVADVADTGEKQA